MKMVWRCNLEMEIEGDRLQAREGRRIGCAKTPSLFSCWSGDARRGQLQGVEVQRTRQSKS
ncbi:hypothetical protein TRIATDRAFT_301532 [Trichoderma atroviride IMI 206040]|uniref:Uncharacterized protein n=1 Tax=Hypocrea atroviridis (strain ATCC 20476 / IMI 206040) TaxID=452589 RepID=G9P763_HYPAI|nr:uncharacterized protein TRIATDRAFT_301532 [Trichoderma atroviride IMI 206040]EHK40735.1 hypothetical protein TRIATDRAFT_301532 [Trichoderma atroviride IMI 206040]